MTHVSRRLFGATLTAALALIAMGGGLSIPAHAQTALTQITTSAAVSQTDKILYLSSTTGISGTGSLNQPQTMIYIDRELMTVLSVSGNTVTVMRGQGGTNAKAHISGAQVWAGPPSAFANSDPSGACTATAQPYTPTINTDTGRLWVCGAQGQWARGTDGAFFVPAENCIGTVTGTAGSGNNTLVVDGSVLAWKLSSTNASASNATFVCTFTPPPTRTTGGRGAVLTDITFLYSPQTTTATGIAGATFKYYQPPAAGVSETASSATLVATGGTLAYTPALASANLTAVSAGQYYSQAIVLGTPEPLTNDLRSYMLTFTVQQSASAAQIVTTPGFWVHYIRPLTD